MFSTYLSFSDKATMGQTNMVDDRYTNDNYLFLAQQLKSLTASNTLRWDWSEF